MSYPTPWRVEPGGDILSADNQFVVESAAGVTYELGITLDDLVSRINAGAEANARAERAEKALEQAVGVCRELIEYWSEGGKFQPEQFSPGTERIWKMALEVTNAYLKEKEKKL